ncbi:hypothetical protein BH09MYX1_BH09MYX1_62940 [soil metagenome]
MSPANVDLMSSDVPASSLERLLLQLANPTEVQWNEETYDLALASGLSLADRAEYVARLIETARIGDTHAILTLGHLHAIEALPMLQASGSSADPWAHAARRALVLLGHGAEVVERIARDATCSPAPMARVAAVMDLPKIGGVVAIAALEHALADEDYAVRMLAWDGLVTGFGLERLLQNPDGKRELSTHVELLRVLLASDLASFVQMGRREMRELLNRLRAGETPQSLGVMWAPDPAPELFAKLRLTLFDLESTFPVNEIAQLTGIARRWAEMMIALRLESHDPRVGAALLRLRASWTVPALEEVAASTATSPALRHELADVVRMLKVS